MKAKPPNQLKTKTQFPKHKPGARMDILSEDIEVTFLPANSGQ